MQAVYKRFASGGRRDDKWFYESFTHLKNFENKGSFEGWIRQIMINESISYLRANKKIYFTEEENFYEDGYNEVEIQFSVDELQFLIDSLPDGYKMVFKSHKSFRFGIGGYAGIRLKTKQILYYEDEYGDCVKQKTKKDFNASNFIYGLSAYMGYKATSLYVKYDLNPLFQDNAVKQNNVSLGVRFDFN